MNDETAPTASRELADYRDDEIVFGLVPGIVFQRALVLGRIAPQSFNDLIGIRVVEVAGDGTTVSRAQPDIRFANGGGPLHGGYLSALMDCATASSVHSVLPEGVGAPHVHVSYRFLTAGNPTRPLEIRAKVTHKGRQVIHAAVEITDDRGSVIASGETIHKVRSIRARSLD